MLISTINLYSQKYILTLDDVINTALISSLESEKIEINKFILETNTIIEKKKFLPRLDFSLSAPNYNRSISPILQPDGTKKYQDIQTASYNSALQLQYPLWFSGGNISIQSTINQLYNLNKLSSNSLGSNLFQISISQPLSFYSSQKWDKKISEIKNEILKKDILREKVSIKKQAIILFFDLLIAQETLNLNKNIYNYSKELYDKSIIKHARNNISHQDLLKVKIGFNDANIKLKNANDSYIISKNKLLSFLKLNNHLNLDLISPNNLNKINLNEDSVIQRAIKCNIIEKKSMNSLSNQKEIKYYKSQLLGSGSISISAGINSSANDYKHLYENNREQQSVSVSLIIPIINWGDAKNNYNLSRLKAEKNEIEMLVYEKNMIDKLIEDIKTFNIYKSKFINIEENINLKEEYLTLSKKMLENERIDVVEYKYVENSYIESKVDQIQLLRDIWIKYIDLEAITLFNYTTNSEL